MEASDEKVSRFVGLDSTDKKDFQGDRGDSPRNNILKLDLGPEVSERLRMSRTAHQRPQKLQNFDTISTMKNQNGAE